MTEQTKSAQVPTELRVDASYRNSTRKAEDEFYSFFRFSDNQGLNNSAGFKAKKRKNGSSNITECAFCILVTTFDVTEWPDSLDYETGLFTYFGDNKDPEYKLDETPIGGNRLLEKVFESLHKGDRASICPFLCFESYQGAEGRYMRFLGLAVPGAQGLSQLDDLVAVWRRSGKRRFLNYKAIFTILDAESVPHSWLEEIVSGVPPTEASGCPPAFAQWVNNNTYTPLTTPPVRVPRSKTDQLPRTPREETVLQAVRSLDDREFEYFTKALLEMMDRRFFGLEVTPRVKDEGRDVVGEYRVGHENHWIALEVCAEAKHWKNSIGVTQMMRLISRIKHRDFGIFVTTSHFDPGVQKELIKDRHPVVLVSGGDIARVLIANDLESEALRRWLDGIRQDTTTRQAIPPTRGHSTSRGDYRRK